VHKLGLSDHRVEVRRRIKKEGAIIQIRETRRFLWTMTTASSGREKTDLVQTLLGVSDISQENEKKA